MSGAYDAKSIVGFSHASPVHLRPYPSDEEAEREAKKYDVADRLVHEFGVARIQPEAAYQVARHESAPH